MDRDGLGELTIPSLTWPWLSTSLSRQGHWGWTAGGHSDPGGGQACRTHSPSFLGLEQDLLDGGLQGAGLVLLQHLPAACTARSTQGSARSSGPAIIPEVTALPCPLVASFPALGSFWLLVHGVGSGDDLGLNSVMGRRLSRKPRYLRLNNLDLTTRPGKSNL